MAASAGLKSDTGQEGVIQVNCVAAAFARFGVLKGLWQYLTVRSELRTALEKERERNRALAAHREGLPDNAELMDYEDGEGRKFWIRKYGQVGNGPAWPLPSAIIVELDSEPAARNPPLEGAKRIGELGP
jgi:hypothetical protein